MLVPICVCIPQLGGRLHHGLWARGKVKHPDPSYSDLLCFHNLFYCRVWRLPPGEQFWKIDVHRLHAPRRDYHDHVHRQLENNGWPNPAAEEQLRGIRVAQPLHRNHEEVQPELALARQNSFWNRELFQLQVVKWPKHCCINGIRSGLARATPSLNPEEDLYRLPIQKVHTPLQKLPGCHWPDARDVQTIPQAIHQPHIREVCLVFLSQHLQAVYAKWEILRVPPPRAKEPRAEATYAQKDNPEAEPANWGDQFPPERSVRSRIQPLIVYSRF